MSFILEVVKNGKDVILFNNFKYRETYSIKSGDIVWKCLGKSCKAAIKTNKEKTVIFSSSCTHSGQHPVTMRALTSSSPRASPSTPKSALDPTRSLEPSSTPVQTKTKMNPAESSGLKSGVNITDLTTLESAFRTENEALKDELSRLREERQLILDHSIESDLRLMQYTEDVFPSPHSSTVNSCSNKPSVSHQDTRTESPPLSKTASTKTEQELSRINENLKYELESARNIIEQLEILVNKNNKPCEKCKILQDETNKMLISIKCMEEEVKCLRSERQQTHLQPSTRPHLVHLNRFDVLGGENPSGGEGESLLACNDVPGFTTVKRKKKKTKPIIKEVTTNINQTKFGRRMKANIPFESLSILGDSHVRDLPAIIRDLVQPTASVIGMCKPNAGILNIVPTTRPPRNNCYVLMGGTNDIDAGREIDIFSNLEKVLRRCTSSSKILLVPLLPRHDLPRYSPVHRTVRVVNHYMQELCERFNGAELLDISAISRLNFTSHGLHLRASGKRLLASLIVRSLAAATSLEHSASIRPTSIPVVIGSTQKVYPATALGTSNAQTKYPTSTAEPFTLPHDTFADAVKQRFLHKPRTLSKNTFLERSLEFQFQP